MTPGFISKVEEAERGLLSCLRENLLETGAVAHRSGITADHFQPPRRAVYAVLIDHWQKGQQYDFLSLCTALRASGDMEAFPSREDLRAQLYEPSVNAAAHASTLLECHAARGLYSLGDKLTAGAFQAENSTSELLEEARNVLLQLNSEPPTKKTSLQHFMLEALDNIEAVAENSIEFGLGLDEAAGPFCRGDLIVVAGETKHGKSALASNIVENVASKGHRCGIFSLEMSGAQNAERMIASQSRVDIRSMKLRRRMMPNAYTGQDEQERARILRAIESMNTWKVEIIEQSHGLKQIAADMVRLKLGGGLDLTVVDYAQLVDGIRAKGDNREREVASISSLLKRTAVQTDSIVMLLSQLNDDGRLRESRAIGQDANCVLFIEGEGDKRTVRVGAARSAPTGTEIALDWKPIFTRFSIP